MSLEILALRAEMLAKVRAFFKARGVMEVETPILSHAASSDPNVDSLRTHYTPPDYGVGISLYLHTSPEYAMKRLLAAGAGPIYQITKVFRDGEEGRLHNPEFTLLEWYRPKIGYLELMDEVEALIRHLADTPPSERLTYAQAFKRYAGVDPYRASLVELRNYASACGFEIKSAVQEQRDVFLDFILAHHVAPKLGGDCATFIYEYPASQATLANISPREPVVSERFELFMRGIEIANGSAELTDPIEHRRRFSQAEETRRQRGADMAPRDQRFLSALESGLPPCAGVALGFDRMLMLQAGVSDIADVLTFPVAQA
ncbi:MAG: EF-P lysine aminoacylase GenX [Gammaproteobacteria bacterium]|nr:EF-P lysine aminoacylase GenX [Gammaproteobacteria bacterium]MCI0591051.1 EF-P lysine aminoacylase GenX [Gammaproteobacteria bacterium]